MSRWAVAAVVAGVAMRLIAGAIPVVEMSEEAAPSGATAVVPLNHAIQVLQLPRKVAQKGLAARIQGVTTCVLPELHALVVQDATGGIYVSDITNDAHDFPQLGDRVEVEGTTQPGIISATRVRRLGVGTLPAPEYPSWDQLLNGSLDCRRVEIRGLMESVLNRKNGWSRVIFRTRDGVLRIELRRAGIQPDPLDSYLGAVVRLRGCLFAAWNTKTHEIKQRQIRFHDVAVEVDEAAPRDPFAVPETSAAALLRYDPSFSTFHRVRICGQVVFVRGYDCFVMDGPNGLRLLSDHPLGLAAGDRIEAVGFPEWGYASPCLMGVVVRKLGRAPLPQPIPLSPAQLLNPQHDATRVSVEGVLASVHPGQSGRVLELQSGMWRFLARVNSTNSTRRRLTLGSRLRLVGVYSAEGAYRALGKDVAPIELLVGSASDIRVLATPSWWTMQRLVAVAGVLAFLLFALALWVVSLRHQVEARTSELAIQIRNREQAEHQRAVEAERARIARDLHDELGADLTEIGMLANRSRASAGPAEERRRCLEHLADKTGRMVAALEEIVWAMNPQRDSLASVISYFSYYAEHFLGLAGIKLLAEESARPPDRAVDARVRHELFRAFKESLANVVSHAGASEVRLGFELAGDELRLTVADNGRGLPADKPHLGDGLTNMKARIEKLGGSFELSGRSGGGTTVQFRLPLT